MQKSSASRQRKWQLKQREAGRCSICPKPAEKWGLCPDHVQIATERRRKSKKVAKPYPSKNAWKSVDWSLGNKEIASAMGVTEASVRYHRIKN